MKTALKTSSHFWALTTDSYYLHESKVWIFLVPLFSICAKGVTKYWLFSLRVGC